MRRSELAPFRLIGLYFVGSFLLCSGYAWMNSSWSFLRVPHVWDNWFFGLAVAILGGILAWRSYSALSDGVRLERWSHEELQKPRAFLEHPSLRKLVKVLVAAAILIWLVDTVKMFTHHGYPTHVYMSMSIIYFASLTIVSRRFLAEPRTSRSNKFLDAVVTLRSEHWGR